MLSSAKLCTLLLICAGTVSVLNAKVIFCYWGTWAYYRPGQGKFEASHIDPHLCTHIAYSFFGITDAGTIRLLDSWLDKGLKNIAKTVALKKQNTNLKVLAAVGGWSEGSEKYSSMAANPSKRAAFISSVIALLKEYGFDGVDLDWEYPNQRGGITADRKNFIILLRELKAALQQHQYLFTAAVAAAQTSASQSYNIPEMSQYLDLINVMAYDFHGSWENVLGYNSPLQGPGPLTSEAAIEYWLSAGAPASKLVMGIPLYGRTFTLQDNSRVTVGSPTRGAGEAGSFTREAGYLGYNEICLLNQWQHKWDAYAISAYAHYGNQWVGYDNEQSIIMKVNFIKKHNLAGAMVWSIETDDFHGNCGKSKYPLLNAINTNMGSNSVVVQPTTPAPTIPVHTTTTTVSPRACTADGYYRNENDCTRFYICTFGNRHDFLCPPPLYFDISVTTCNWPNLVDCKNY